MIALLYDLSTGVARLERNTIIKLGADVPVRVTFAAAPGEVTMLQAALGTDAAAPDTLAYTDTFTQENATTWTALLDASDTRLATFMTGKGPTPVNLELASIVDGVQRIAPNVSVTVQPRIITATETPNNALVPDDAPIQPAQAFVDAALAVAELEGVVFLLKANSSASYVSAPIGKLVTLNTLTTFTGNLGLTYCSISEITALASVGIISGMLDLTGNTISDLTGLDAVTTVSGTLALANCGIGSLAPLASLATISGSVDLSGNDVYSAAGLDALRTLSGTLNLQGDLIANVTALHGITTLSGTLDLSSNQLTSAALDALFIALAASVTVGGGTINVGTQGTSEEPTSASAAARAFLTGTRGINILI